MQSFGIQAFTCGKKYHNIFICCIGLHWEKTLLGISKFSAEQQAFKCNEISAVHFDINQ